MPNPHRGEVQIKAGDKTYTLLFGTTAQCAIEKELGMSLGDIAKLETVSGLRDLLWACLLKHHKDIGIPADLDDLIDEVGIHATRDAVVKAITLGVPKSESGAEAKNA
jgi:hypothetical protein